MRSGIRETPQEPKKPAASAKLTIRDRLAKTLLWGAVVVAPPQMRSILAYVFRSIEGVPGQIEQGRDGGVIIAPWFISEDGSDLAHEQARRCNVTAGKTRAEFEALKGSGRSLADAPSNPHPTGDKEGRS